MLHAVTEVLKSAIADTVWLERFGGLVTRAVKPLFIDAPDGTKLQTGTWTAPVSCEVNEENCWEGDKLYKYFEPDSNKAAVGFFDDAGGVSFVKVDQPKAAWLVFKFNVRFLCWLNLKRLNADFVGCNFSALASGELVSKFYGRHSSVGLFAGGAEETAFQGIEVTGITQPIKTPAIFEPFSFAKQQEAKGLFLYPYDYFALNLTGTFAVNKNCFPQLFTEPPNFAADYCLPS